MDPRHRLGRCVRPIAAGRSSRSDLRHGAQLGGALGIAILGSIITAVYRTDIAAGIPADVPPDAAVAARNNLNATLIASRDLPQPTADRLLDTARDAFTNGLQLTGAISAVLMIATAVLVLTTNRRRRPSAAPADDRTRTTHEAKA